MDDVLAQAGGLEGKVVVSCSLPMSDGDTQLVVGHASSGAEELARKAPGAAIVSGFGTVWPGSHTRVSAVRRWRTASGGTTSRND